MANLGAYWWLVATRALSRTLTVTGLTPTRIRQRALLLVGAAVAAVAVGAVQTLIDKGAFLLLLVLGALGVFALVFLWQMVVAPAVIWQEQADEAAALKKATATREDNASRIKTLEGLCERGQELQGRPNNAEDWCLAVEAWDAEVHAALAVGFAHDAFGYRTINPRPPHPRHADRLLGTMEFLDGRINKLRKIIMRAHDELRDKAAGPKAVTSE